MIIARNTYNVHYKIHNPTLLNNDNKRQFSTFTGTCKQMNVCVRQ